MTDTPNSPHDPIDDLFDPASDDSTTADDLADAAPPSAGTSTAGPPPPPPQPVPRRLVRDPYTRLGGVASGLSKYWGIDVSIVRIVILLLAVTTGFGLLAYLVAWIIIPRADHWPPGGPVARPFQSMSKRDLGIGLAAVGLLTVLAFGGGTTGSVLVPLVLVGGGVWLLLQPGSERATALVGSQPAAFAGGTGTVPGPAGPGSPPPPAAYLVTPPGPPVPPRSRRRRRWIAGVLIGLVFFIIAIPLALIAAVGIAIANGDFLDEPVTYVIDDADDLPFSVSADGGEITVDLADLDPADFTVGDDPVLVDVELGAGTVTVIVPDELDVNVDAEAGLGDVTVFGRSDSGPASDVSSLSDDAVVEIEIDLGLGEIDVIRR